MKLTQDMKQKANWARLIRLKRAQLKETQTQFGARFGVTHTSVSYWELNMVEPPAELTWWLYKDELKKERRVSK